MCEEGEKREAREESGRKSAFSSSHALRICFMGVLAELARRGVYLKLAKPSVYLPLWEYGYDFCFIFYKNVFLLYSIECIQQWRRD